MIVPQPLPLPGLSPSTLALAALAQVVLPDTIITVQATPTGWAFWAETLTSIASVIIALALIVGGAVMIPVALTVRKAHRRLNVVLGQVQVDLAPILKHMRALTENLDYISTSVRMDVDQLRRDIHTANQRLGRAASAAERRVQEFNALMKVVQEEAENLFIGTASTIRGVQVGAETFRRFREENGADEENDRGRSAPRSHSNP